MASGLDACPPHELLLFCVAEGPAAPLLFGGMACHGGFLNPTFRVESTQQEQGC